MATLANGGTAEYKKQPWSYIVKLDEVKMSKQSDYVNEYGVKAYNQGFYKFGLMEQCATGEWVKWKDVEPFLRAAELRVQTAMETEQTTLIKLSAEERSAYEWRELYFGLKSFSTEVLKWNSFWRIVAVGLALMEVVTVFLLTHGY